MDRVCLAHDEVLDRDVALKVLREQFADEEEFVERFKREARSAALFHLNIIQVSLHHSTRLASPKRYGDRYGKLEHFPTSLLPYAASITAEGDEFSMNLNYSEGSFVPKSPPLVM